ncbi:hypothetical protein [Microbacterium sp. Marseille-Q6648]|uniref:hypothetical protein n=1 Tax=Microbacterium sp. Marseille-Q6648 TaxID=2937991 RepID=UPI00203CFC13|nr:hypothetical protein [Microbacterium sp. Marseille-Q6648]
MLRGSPIQISWPDGLSVDGGHERHLRIPFTAPGGDLVRAVEILAEAWPRVRDSAPTSVHRQMEPVI